MKFTKSIEVIETKVVDRYRDLIGKKLEEHYNNEIDIEVLSGDLNKINLYEVDDATMVYSTRIRIATKNTTKETGQIKNGKHVVIVDGTVNTLEKDYVLDLVKITTVL